MNSEDEDPSGTSTADTCDTEAADNLPLTSSRLLNLPIEVLLDVAERLQGDNQALAALMRSCKRLKLVAEEFLYTIITIPPKSKYKAPHLVRTLLEKPAYALQVSEINLAICDFHPPIRVEREKEDVIEISSQSGWIADMVKHFIIVNNDIASWMYRALSGYVPSIAMMLPTLLPCVTNINLLLYEDTPFAERLNDINRLLFGNFESSTALALLLVFRSPLSSVKRLRLSSGNMEFLHLPFHSVEIIELDLGVERASSSSQFLSTRSNIVESLNLPAYPRLVYPRLRTLVLYSDWSELLHFPNRLPVLGILLRMITGLQLRRLEFYTKWSPRKAPQRTAFLSIFLLVSPRIFLPAYPRTVHCIWRS
jgi:hypothetical protein